MKRLHLFLFFALFISANSILADTHVLNQINIFSKEFSLNNQKSDSYIIKMEKVIAGLKEAGLRESTKVLIGGAPINEKFCDRINADYYAESAADAVTVAKSALKDLKEAEICV